ncbi:hypothetical protein R3W88_034130 [Solanum pinnatisectum]|uniref:F-box domain-containing protein n=1 Tax=Solanum pinnatisectum TaxID=50273 RepID=A0AAV9JZA7_9SOLN|nr:hypothetical protein R3W88_034130 [Solanum pinnatisectum]
MATNVEDDDVHPFPEYLAKEILQDLVVKSLLRFKCVCKRWYTLISSRNFISQHLNYHENNKHPKVLICDHCALDDLIDNITIILNSEGTPLIEKLHHLLGFDINLFLEGPKDGVFLFLQENSHVDYDCKLGL